jgi:mRNA interferase MazF
MNADNRTVYNKNFDDWSAVKKQINEITERPFFRIREVWFCSIGSNIGYEQDGKNGLFERPVLIVKRFNDKVFWGIPLSTKFKPQVPYYVPFIYEKRVYSAIILQLRLWDAKRLVRKIYTLPPDEFNLIIAKTRDELNTKTDS